MKEINPSTDQPIEPLTLNASDSHEKVIKPQGSIKTNATVVETDETNSKTKRLFLTILGVILIIVIVVGVFAILISKDSKDTKTKGPTPGNNQINASSLLDYSSVCSGSKIINAITTDAKKRRIAFFDEVTTNSGQYSLSDVALEDSTWEADYTKYTSTQLVGCLTRIKETNTGIKCDLTDDNKQDQKVSVYNVTYRLTIYDASTGQLLDTKNIEGTASSCPYFATYTQNNPKIYALPEKSVLSAAVKEYVVEE